MEAPKCKSCGKREWRHVCGIDGDRVHERDVGPGDSSGVSKRRQLGRDPDERVSVDGNAVSGKVRGARPKKAETRVEQGVAKGSQDRACQPATEDGKGLVVGFDRNAYQREYMRKRRAAAKEAK